MSPILHSVASAAAAASAAKHLLGRAGKHILMETHQQRQKRLQHQQQQQQRPQPQSSRQTFCEKPRERRRCGEAGEKVNICFHLDYSEKSIAHEENGFNELR